MSKKIRYHTDLDAYQIAFDAAMLPSHSQKKKPIPLTIKLGDPHDPFALIFLKLGEEGDIQQHLRTV